MAFWFFGGLIWFYKILFPPPALSPLGFLPQDALWILGYPFVFYAIFARLDSLESARASLAKIQTAGVISWLLVTAALVFGVPAAFAVDASQVQKTLNLFYASADFLLFYGAIAVSLVFADDKLSLENARSSHVWLLLGGGFAAHSISNILFGALIIEGTYSAVGFVNFLFALSYGLLALGAFYLNNTRKASAL